MQQTLMAFLAVMLVMLFSLNHQQARLQSNKEVVSSELEIGASAVASEVLHFIGTKPFDARTADGSVTPPFPDVNLLTSAEHFGHGRLFDACEDIDDFNEIDPLTQFFEIRDGDGFDFTINITVRYIDSSGNETSSPTWIKEVTLFVSGPATADGEPLMNNPYVVKRRFSPEWMS